MNQQKINAIIFKAVGIDEELRSLENERFVLMLPLEEYLIQVMQERGIKNSQYLSPSILHIKSGGWDCPASPTKYCVYNELTDSPHDFCLFCGNPEERK